MSSKNFLSSDGFVISLPLSLFLAKMDVFLLDGLDIKMSGLRIWDVQRMPDSQTLEYKDRLK